MNGCYRHFCLLCASVPSEPAALSVAVESEEKALLSWLSPQHSNGQLTSYSVYIRYCLGQGGGITTNCDTSTVVCSSLI